MPTYEYQCAECGHHFEQFQLIKAKALRECPVCGVHKLQRLIGSGGALIFRGSGFYQTDYRSESYQKAAKVDKEDVTTGKDDSKESTGASKSGKKEGKQDNDIGPGA